MSYYSVSGGYFYIHRSGGSVVTVSPIDEQNAEMSTRGSASSSTSAAAWQHEARGLLERSDAREKLDAYALLSAKCCASKELQNAVGALLREKPVSGMAQRLLLDVVFGDIQASDRTIRVAATRLICQVAYENLLNQDSVVQLANGFAVGWVHVFSIPQAFQEQYAADCVASNRQQTTRGLRDFLNSTVINSYGSIYKHVSSYYSGGCSAFLPLAWQFPASSAQDDVPDPASHLIGFYLVPRQTQFPEQDDFYSDELLGAMDSDDVEQIQGVHRSFMVLATQRSDGKVLKSVLSRAFADEQDVQWALGVDAESETDVEDVFQSVEPICQYFVQERATGSDREDQVADCEDATVMTWNEVLVYCCLQINAEKLRATFGVETFVILVDLFRQLSLNAVSVSDGSSSLSRGVCGGTFVWEAVLVGAIQDHPTLPDALKRHVASFRRGLYHQHSDPRSTVYKSRYLRESWRYLLALRLDQIQPLSWCLFLTQWRVAADNFHTLDNPQRRTTTVCSVSNIRRSMVSMDPRSFQSLDELRQELPNICRSQLNIFEGAVQESSGIISDEDADFEHHEDWKSQHSSYSKNVPSQPQNGETENGSLAHYLKLFHRMQHSPSNLDKLSLQQLQEKQAATSKLNESVANNKKRLIYEAKRKRLEVEARLREEEEKREELERRKAEARSSVHQKQTTRHDMVMRRRQQQLAQEEVKQQALMAQIEFNQLEFRTLMEAKQLQQQAKKKQNMPQEGPISHSSRSSSAVAKGSKRPMSARNPAAAVPPPEILRQRAQIYGDVVSKIYLAEASRHPQPPPLAATSPSMQSPHLARRFSNFRKQSALVSNIVDSEQQQQQSSHSIPSQKLEWKFHSNSTSVLTRDDDHGSTLKVDGISSACTTLVMRNAALAVSERISIPTIPTPVVMDPRVPAYVIEAQYSALETHHKQKFRERFNLKSISHRLSYTVLKQFTKIVRRNTAWEEFHSTAARSNSGRPSEKVRHADFVLVAQQLGVSLSAKKLMLVARHLDENKNGFVAWESFYAWWSAQYEDAFVPSKPS